MFKNKKLISFLVFVLSTLLLAGCSSRQENLQENNYLVSLKQIKNKEYKEAMNNLMKCLEYKDSKILYSYCQYKKLSNEGNFTFAQQYLDKIPNNYSGELKDEILKDKNQPIEDKIKMGFQLVDSKKYSEAVSLFSLLNNKDKSTEPLFYYAKSIESYKLNDIMKASDYVHRIGNYTGFGSDRVISYRDQIIKETDNLVQKENEKIKTDLQKIEEDKAQQKIEYEKMMAGKFIAVVK